MQNKKFCLYCDFSVYYFLSKHIYFAFYFKSVFCIFFACALFDFLYKYIYVCVCVCVNELRLYGSLSMISKLKFQHIFDQSYLFICLCFENLYFSCIYENSYRYFVNIFLFYYQSIYCVQIYSKLYAITQKSKYSYIKYAYIYIYS